MGCLWRLAALGESPRGWIGHVRRAATLFVVSAACVSASLPSRVYSASKRSELFLNARPAIGASPTSTPVGFRKYVPLKLALQFQMSQGTISAMSTYLTTESESGSGTRFLSPSWLEVCPGVSGSLLRVVTDNQLPTGATVGWANIYGYIPRLSDQPISSDARMWVALDTPDAATVRVYRLPTICSSSVESSGRLLSVTQTAAVSTRELGPFGTGSIYYQAILSLPLHTPIVVRFRWVGHGPHDSRRFLPRVFELIGRGREAVLPNSKLP